MFEVIAINIGAMVAMFCGYKFAVNHLRKEYTGLFDLFIRLILVIGVLSSSLFMPILLQKSRFPQIYIGIFMIGPYLGIFLAIFTYRLEKKGKLIWPKDRKSAGQK